ncbi:MAG: aminotransferase class V-fold PLP-dependent enzyme [Actinomycetota bacterium]
MPLTGEQRLLDLDHFTDLADTTYLYTGAHSPAVRQVEAAMVAAYRQKSRGELGRDALAETELATRRSLGGLAGVAGHAVGLTGDASTVWSAIANGWSWRPGDNIVVNEFEHPAVFAPFLRLRQHGLEVRVVPRDADWDISATALLDHCDDRTVALALSHVGYVTGLRHDLDHLGRELQARAIPFLVDVSHSLGVVDVDLTYVALAVSASYKWLLGPYGVGLVFWNSSLLPGFQPGAVGWRSLVDIFTDRRFEELNWHPDGSRFQMGAPAFAEIAGLGAAADLLAGIDRGQVQEHALALAGSARSALEEHGMQVLTPKDPDRHAGNVAFAHPDGDAVARRLADKGVLLWGGDGRVRASFHVMNDLRDVDRLVDALARDLRQHPLSGVSA